jgi:hypothetical protein
MMGLTLRATGNAKVEDDKASIAPRKTVAISMLC